MKKYFYSMLAATTMLFAASCSQDEVVENVAAGEEVDVTFTTSLEGATATRAISDGYTVNELIFEVYDKDGKRIDALRQEGITVANHAATVKVRLVKGQDYQFVFWAQNADQTYYDVSDLKSIEVTYATETNDEKRDAFYHYEPVTRVTGSFAKNVTLKRPFAQLNLGTTVEDIAAAQTAGVSITRSKIYVKGAIYQTLSTFDGAVETPAADVETSLLVANIPANTETLLIRDDENQFDNDSYKYLATTYLLASAKGSLSTDVQFELYAGTNLINTLKVANAPLQRNWRTNVVGDVLTGEGTFNIIVDPIYDNDFNYTMDGDTLDIWDGTTTMPVQNVQGEYVIDQASDLVGIASVAASQWSGAKFVLTKDLSFKNVGAPTRAGDTTPATIKALFKEGGRNITFNGNNRVIRDFIVKGEAEADMASLFGCLIGGSVNNLTIINADVTGAESANAYSGIVIAKTFGTVTLDNVVVKDSKLKGTQKVGALIGFVAENQVNVLNCRVEGVEINNHDVANESGSTAGLIGCIASGNNNIENCWVKNSTFNTIQNGTDTRANGEFIGVIRGAGTVVNIKNCGVEGNSFTNSVADWNPYHTLFVGGNSGAVLIVNGINSVATLTELTAALNAGKDVVLGTNIATEGALHINAEKEVTIDLNGHTITAGADYNDDPKGLIRVDGGATVTIKNGTVDASTYNGNISAVTVPNGTLIVESGTFAVGDDGTDCNDVIMANPESQVIVNGGTFQYKGQNGKRWLYTLNRPNSNHPVYTYTVNGGTFYQFIPGTTNPDGWGYEVQLGEGKKVYKNDETTPTTDKEPEMGAWYTVK